MDMSPVSVEEVHRETEGRSQVDAASSVSSSTSASSPKASSYMYEFSNAAGSPWISQNELQQQSSFTHYILEQSSNESSSLPLGHYSEGHGRGSRRRTASLTLGEISTSTQGEDETFCDDRSLEVRLRKVLKEGPRGSLEQDNGKRRPRSSVSEEATKECVETRNETVDVEARAIENTSETNASDLPLNSNSESRLPPSSILEEAVARLSREVKDLAEAQQQFAKDHLSFQESQKCTTQINDTASAQRVPSELEQVVQMELLRERETAQETVRNSTQEKHGLEKEKECLLTRLHGMEEKYKSYIAEIKELTNRRKEIELELTELTKDNTSLQQLLMELQNQCANLNKERDDERATLREMQSQLNTAREDATSLQIQRQDASNYAEQENKTLRSTIRSLTEELAIARAKGHFGDRSGLLNTQGEDSTVSFKSISCQTEDESEVARGDNAAVLSPPGTSSKKKSHNNQFGMSPEEKKEDSNRGLLFADDAYEGEAHSRLNRLRDSAERARLVHQHQREIAYLVEEHESELKRMAVSFEKEKEQVEEVASLEIAFRSKEYKTRYERKVSDLQRQHEKEIRKVQEEMKSTALAAAESVEVIMSQLSHIRSKAEEEIQRREVLDKRLVELREEHNTEKTSIAENHEKELTALRSKWEQERFTLVGSVQKECNDVFDRNKTCLSPTSVVTEICPEIASFYSPSQSDQAHKPSVSPSFSELGRSLLETEALVKSLLNKPSPY